MDRKTRAALGAAALLVMVSCASEREVSPKAALRQQGYGDPLNLYGRGAAGFNGVVSSAKPEASEVGVAVLKAGGNAVDAAVAVGFALGVLEPNASGLGGGGFMILRLAGMEGAVVIDFRETSPAAATAEMFLNSDGSLNIDAVYTGGLSNGVPGEVAGLLYALERYGSLSREEALRPAVALARDGYKVTINLNRGITDNLDRINRFPATAAIYTVDGLPPEVGQTIRNPDLAATLEKIARDGRDAFYTGEMAEKIAAASREAGGILTVADLAAYRPEIREPVRGTYRGYTILSTPPASSGGTHVIEILNILENMDVGAYNYDAPETIHAWIQALRLSFADRARYMADPAFVDIPLKGLTSKAYARDLYARFDPAKALLEAEPGDPALYESESTTSFSVMDKAGNMAAVTKSINAFFGSAVVVPGAGFILNDHMGDFAVNDPNSIQKVEPGKRPLSSMSPTLVLDSEGRSFITVGAAGATRIISSVAEIISRVIDHKMPVEEAIMAPRYFASASGQVQLEGRLPAASVRAIEAMGYAVQLDDTYRSWSPSLGVAQAALYDHETGVIYGGADPRRDGQAKSF